MEKIKNSSATLPRVIFLSLSQIDSLEDNGIYHDLLRQFILNAYEVVVVCPVERRNKKPTSLIKTGNIQILQVKTLNVQKTPLFEKGIATISINFLFKRAIKKYLGDQKFDIVLYTTPPITISRLIGWLKRRYSAVTYLLLKDIFPQNAVDLGMIKPGSLLHKYFLSQEKRLYANADMIGCMSPANMQYIQKHHPNLIGKVEVNPNSIEIRVRPQFTSTKEMVFEQLNIPVGSTLFIYGGNLGKPQGTFFLTEIISKCATLCPNAFFLIVGSGTDFNALDAWFTTNKPVNAKLIGHLPKKKYNEIIAHADVGLILLRSEFTIPNFPSRLLSYLENKLPVLSITDEVSDIGPISEEAGFGKWCKHGNLESAIGHIIFFEKNKHKRQEMGETGYSFLCENYNVNLSYKKINGFYQEKRQFEDSQVNSKLPV